MSGGSEAALVVVLQTAECGLLELQRSPGLVGGTNGEAGDCKRGWGKGAGKGNRHYDKLVTDMLGGVTSLLKGAAVAGRFVLELRLLGFQLLHHEQQLLALGMGRSFEVALFGLGGGAVEDRRLVN